MVLQKCNWFSISQSIAVSFVTCMLIFSTSSSAAFAVELGNQNIACVEAMEGKETSRKASRAELTSILSGVSLAPEPSSTSTDYTTPQKGGNRSTNRILELEKIAQTKYENGDTRGCIKTLKHALHAYDDSGIDRSLSEHASLLMLRGDCFYHDEKYGEAVEQYSAAYSDLKKSEKAREGALEDCLNALAGSYVHEKEYGKAAPVYEELVARTEAISGRDSVKLLWAFLDLINIYKQLGRSQDVEQLRDRVLTLLSAAIDKQDLEKGVRAQPAGSSEQRPIPLIVWRAKTSQPKGIIIAVHGLGLHCASYQKFAERMNDQNFGVCAMDVRGFGSWRLARGREQIDLENSIQDIAGLVGLTHLKYPEVPVFVLGESMGGALALRYAADFPETVSGVISSVPADRRYKAKKEAFRVALNFLKHPNKPMSVENVLSRAAYKDSVSKDVFDDPLMRAELSPRELIKFQFFMTQTALKAGQIKDCPVLMVQGMKDRLAKPGATIDLFNNLATSDRDLYLVGQCQHLIFEEVDTPDVVFQSLLVWLDNRIGQRGELGSFKR
jgi:alpha-beta hydrolase superfamily lysophospholipase